GGESIRSWLEYFPNAMVHGVDQIKDTNPWNTQDSGADKRYSFCQGYQESDVFWKCWKADYPVWLDIIIDDGGHFNDGIIMSWTELWPALNHGGLYCIEDLGVCYTQGSIFVKPGFPQHIDFIKSLIDRMHTQKDIEYVDVSQQLAII